MGHRHVRIVEQLRQTASSQLAQRVVTLEYWHVVTMDF